MPLFYPKISSNIEQIIPHKSIRKGFSLASVAVDSAKPIVSCINVLLTTTKI